MPMRIFPEDRINTGMRLLQLYEAYGYTGPTDPNEMLEELLRMNVSGILNPEEIKKALFDTWSDHWGEYARAFIELQEFIDTVEFLHTRGGTIYRIIFAPSQEEIDTKVFGDHWTHSTSIIDHYIDGTTFSRNPEYGEMRPFLITATIAPNVVSDDGNWVAYPEEQEIGIKSMDGIVDYVITEYRE